MANKRGFEIINGKMYLDGVEIQGGGGGGYTPVHNTFSKICVFGTSIECTPAGENSWSGFMARKLGLTYGTDVLNFGVGGAGVTWYDHAIPVGYNGGSDYDVHLLSAFSCTAAEKDAAAEYFISQGKITREAVNAAKASYNWHVCYDESLLGNLDADLYILGTYGINDRQFWAKWNDANGKEQTWGALHDDLAFDRRTIYGAYNYVLRQLYARKPNAKVVILGQHTYQFDSNNGQLSVNGIQRAVAQTWQIPFADWGKHLPIQESYYHATKEGNDAVPTLSFISDQVHPTSKGAELLGTWVADWITTVELTPLNPRFIDVS